VLHIINRFVDVPELVNVDHQDAFVSDDFANEAESLAICLEA